MLYDHYCWQRSAVGLIDKFLPVSQKHTYVEVGILATANKVGSNVIIKNGERGLVLKQSFANARFKKLPLLSGSEHQANGIWFIVVIFINMFLSSTGSGQTEFYSQPAQSPARWL